MMQQLDLKLIQPAMKEACSVLDILLQAGFSAYFVGGAVRDTLLGKPIHDIDIATSAKPEQVLGLFARSIPTGLQHGTVTVVHNKENYEITTFRTESGYRDHRHPANVTFVTELEQDLQRRDFTINAMAIDANWQLYDPYGGLQHLHNGILATVGDSNQRFQEDALRMLRAIRFAVTYNLQIEEKCKRAILGNGKLLGHIAMERIAYELGRMMQANDPAAAVVLLQVSKLLRHTKQPLYLARGSYCPLPHIGERTASGDWALLFLHLGLTGRQAAHDMEALRLSKQLQYEVHTLLELCEWLNEVSEGIAGTQSSGAAKRSQAAKTVKAATVNKLQQQWLDKLLHYPLEHLELWLGQFAAFTPYMLSLKQYHKALPVKRIKELAVNGQQLLNWCGKPGGAWVKELLDTLFLTVAGGKLKNNKQEIEQFVKAWIEGETINE